MFQTVLLLTLHMLD